MIKVLDFGHYQFWYCTIMIAVLWAASLCSTLLILNMTFDRFYSIIRPHKAASFNTVKRAKITVTSCITLSMLYNSSHLFITSYQGGQCMPYGNAMKKLMGQIYYWLSYIVNFAAPFVLLLVMNSFIIHTIRKGSRSSMSRSEGQGHNEGQIFAILLLVTLSFLLLTTPTYMLFLYSNFVHYEKSPKSFGEFYLFFNVAQKLYYTNNGINFYLYVISGHKFRNDLIRLFRPKTANFQECPMSIVTVSSTQ